VECHACSKKDEKDIKQGRRRERKEDGWMLIK